MSGADLEVPEVEFSDVCGRTDLGLSYCGGGGKGREPLTAETGNGE